MSPENQTQYEHVVCMAGSEDEGFFEFSVFALDSPDSIDRREERYF